MREREREEKIKRITVKISLYQMKAREKERKKVGSKETDREKKVERETDNVSIKTRGRESEEKN